MDDLDRLDPEHVFRILNVLSAFFEKEHENKFGFDKIIIVADYSNIKSIFHHKYGKDVDFSGYLDKFFTITPFYFDNRKAILAAIETHILPNIRSDEPQWNSALSNGGYIMIFLCHIFTMAIENKVMNLRELIKLIKFKIIELKKGSYYSNDFFEDDNGIQKCIDMAIKIAILIFSNAENFVEKIEIFKKANNKIKPKMNFFHYICPMLMSINKMPGESGDHVDYKEYRITSTSDHRRISVKDMREEELFYDLLIDYISERKFLNRKIPE